MTLHPQAERYLAAMGPATESLTAEVLKQSRVAMRAALPDEADRTQIEHVVDVDAGGVPARLYRPSVGAPVALYVHGGGWALHDVETHDPFCRYLADATGWALLAVDYRRAPEHPYPAPLDDVQAAASWLRGHAAELSVDARWLPAIGDSAGANLIAGLAVRDAHALDALMLLYPVVDRELVMGEHDNAALDVRGMDWFWDAYAPGELATHPDASVLRADLSAFPPTLIVTAEHDVLRDQAERFAAALARADRTVVAHRALGMVHSFWRFPEVFDASAATVAQVGALLDLWRSGAISDPAYGATQSA